MSLTQAFHFYVIILICIAETILFIVAINAYYDVAVA